MRITTILTLLLYAPLACALQKVIGPTSPLDSAFDDLVNRTLQKWQVPGLSIAVVSGDNTYAKVLP